MNILDNWTSNALNYLGPNFRHVLLLSEAHQFNVLSNIILILGIYISMYIYNINNNNEKYKTILKRNKFLLH